MLTPIFCITSYSRRNNTEIWNCIELQQKRSCKWCETTCLSWWQYSSLEEDWKKSWCNMNRVHYWHTTYTKYFLAGMCKGHLQKKKYSTALPWLQNELFQTERFSYHKNYTDNNMHSQFTQHYQPIANKRFVTRELTKGCHILRFETAAK